MMRFWTGGAAASAMILAAGAAQADEPRAFTSQDVFALEFAADPRMSPDGETIVYVRRSMDIMTDRVVGDLWTLDVDSGAHRPLLDAERSVSSPRWSPDGTRLAYIESTEDGPDLRILFLDDDRSFSVAQLSEGTSAPVWSPDGTQLAFSMFAPSDGPSFATPPKKPKGAEWSEPVRVFDDLPFRSDGGGYLREGATHVYVVPAEGGTPRAITEGENDFGGPTWLDADTLLVVGNDVEDAWRDPIESEVYAVDVADGTLTALTSRDGPDTSPAVSPNGRSIAYLGYDDEVRAYQQTDLFVMANDGSGSRNLTAGYDRAIDGPLMWRPDGRAILARVEVDGDVALMSFPADGGDPSLLTKDVGGTSIGRPYASGSFTVAKQGGARAPIAYTQVRTDRPADVALLAGRGGPQRLTDLNADSLGHIDLATIEEITVPSRHDGLPVEFWVAMPPGVEKDGTAPMIIEIHGGPYAMYGPFFAAEIQRFAAEGYVTVYANPRGSTGYGEAFAQEIDRNYPSNDHEDLMTVVDYLVAENYVSEDRLFITGGSGGGVLTAWAVGKTDRFAAAASIKPVINWLTLGMTADAAAFFTRHWLPGPPWEDPMPAWELSPISLVGNVETPTLMMVGEEDWRTPTWEAEQFYTALKLRGVDTALIRIPGASHAIASRPSRLIAKVDNIMGWFAEYDPAKAEDDAEDDGGE